MSIQGNTALLAIVLLLWSGLASGAPAQKPQVSRDQALKGQLIEIPAGSVVEVRLHDKQKLRGKLGAVSDAGFEMQTVRDGKISSLNLNFGEVRSIKLQGKGMSTGAKITLGILAGIGAFFLIVLAIGTATGGFED